jgi:microcystin-dependent protein
MLLNLKKTTWLLALPVAALLLVGGTARSQAALPVGTGFTYQGQLTSGGSPVNGNCDFQFGLWDAATDGAQIGAAQGLNSVSVTNGLFTVTMDFGGTAFTGEARWLEIAVRCPSGSGGYATLAPRQALTAAPYAFHAQSAPWSGLAGVPTGFADGVDNDTQYTAGNGLMLSGNELSIAPGAISGDLLGSGAITATHVLSSEVQLRVSDDCAVGSSIRTIDADGTVTCETDDDTTYAAGSGLSLSGNQFSIPPGGVTATHVLSSEIQLRVSGSCAVGEYIRAIAENGAVTCGADADSGGDITEVNAGTGLIGGGATGAITVTLASPYQLPQSCASGQVPVSDGAGGWACAANDTTPSGLVGFFMGGVCPSGWSEITAARGRVIVGLPAGGTNQGTHGTALSNVGANNVTLGVANLPPHTHTVDPAPVTATTSTAGDHTHAFRNNTMPGGSIRAFNADSDNTDAGFSTDTSVLANAGAHSHSVTIDVPSTLSSSTGSGTAFDTSMPYIQLIACSKN